eukprot:scaffold274374_cov40-Tisochrysis_lutea.AAC.3
MTSQLKAHQAAARFRFHGAHFTIHPYARGDIQESMLPPSWTRPVGAISSPTQHGLEAGTSDADVEMH